MSANPLAALLRRERASDSGAKPASGVVVARPRPHLRALTGLRFLAAAHVFLYHTTAWRTWTTLLASKVVSTGYVAVGFFFLLSGFILTYAHAGPGAAWGPGPVVLGRVRRLGAADFYARRFARIYPAYLFALALIAPTFLWHTYRTLGAAVLAQQSFPVLLLVQAFLPSVAMSWNPPAWSLSAEAFFYALFPFVAPRLVALERRGAVLALLGLYALTFVGPLLYLGLAPDGPGAASHDTYSFWLNTLRYNPIVRLPEFLMGIVLGRLYLESERHPAAQSVLRSTPAATAFSLGAALLILGSLVVSPSVPYPLLHNGLLAPAFALLIVSLAANRGPLAAWLGSPPMVLLGEASYSLYLIHIPLVVIWGKTVHALIGPRHVGTTLDFAAFSAFVLAGSIACYRFVERPLQAPVLAAISKLRRTSGT